MGMQHFLFFNFKNVNINIFIFMPLFMRSIDFEMYTKMMS